MFCPVKIFSLIVCLVQKEGIDMEQGKIGRFIRNVRKNKGLTQEELASSLGVTDKSVSR